MWAPGISSTVSFPALSKPRWMATLYRKWPSTWISWAGWQAPCSPKWFVLEHLLSHQALLSPSSCPPLSYPSKLLTSTTPPPPSGSKLPQPLQSHMSLLGHPLRGAPILLALQLHSPPSLFPLPLSQSQALCYQALSLCPTLVYQKSGPFSQPWMSESMHLEQATDLTAKQSGMHDELWNLSWTSLESLVLPGHWTNEWKHVWQIRKSFLGNAWEEKSTICYCDKLKAWWKSLRDDLETRHFLLMA